MLLLKFMCILYATIDLCYCSSQLNTKSKPKNNAEPVQAFETNVTILHEELVHQHQDALEKLNQQDPLLYKSFDNLIDDLIKYKLLSFELSRKLAIFETNQELIDETTWFVQCCSAMETFLDDYSSDAKINFTTQSQSLREFFSLATLLSASRHYSWLLLDWNTLVRSQLWSWILKNPANETRVNTLKASIMESKLYFDNTDRFSEWIAIAFTLLSMMVNKRVLVPGYGGSEIKYITADYKINETNRALDVFTTFYRIERQQRNYTFTDELEHERLCNECRSDYEGLLRKVENDTFLLDSFESLVKRVVWFKAKVQQQFALLKKYKIENKYKLKTLWLVRCKSSLETFEKDHGEPATIDYESIPESLPFLQKTKRIREMRWWWILKYGGNVYDVNRLKKLMQKSQYFKNIDDFVECISIAFNGLSALIRKQVLTTESCDMVPKYSYNVTSNKRANYALEIFMSPYVVGEEVVNCNFDN